MDAHQRLSHIIQRTKLKYGNSAIIAVLHFSHSRVLNNDQNSYLQLKETFPSL
jgi:predicted neuraminidase